MIHGEAICSHLSTISEAIWITVEKFTSLTDNNTNIT